jgi:diguanylate cyclase (GGDEF)-like protein/PAS domain S-box-containing protein
MLQLTAWSLPSLAAILIGAHTLYTLKRSGRVPGARAMRAVGWCVLLWSAGQLIGTLTTSLDLKMLASKLQYPVITLLPVAWMVFAITYIRRRHGLDRRVLALLCALPVATTTLAWSNELHGLIWAEVGVRHLDGFVGLDLRYGPWFRLQSLYAYVLVAAATVMLAVQLSASRHHHRALFAVVAGPAIVAGMNLLHLGGWNPYPSIDPTPLGFALAMLLITRYVLQSGLLQLSPVLHRQVVEQLSDGVVIVDEEGFVIDINPAARSAIGDESGWRLGQRPTDRPLVAPLQGLIDGHADSAEVPVDGRTFHVRATRLDPEAPGATQTVLVLRDITERLEAENELRRVQLEMERLAHTDALTGLHNRRYFIRRLNEETDRVRRYGHALCVLLLDLDLFKDVNDTYGHDAGDRVLQAIARQIDDCKRGSDVTARLGGEEFALALPETSIDGALRLAERLRGLIAEAAVEHPGSAPIRTTASIGIATLSPSTPTAASLLQRADRALYDAKRAGRNTVHCAMD